MDRDTYNAIGAMIFWVLLFAFLVKVLFFRKSDKKDGADGAAEEGQYVHRGDRQGDRRGARASSERRDPAEQEGPARAGASASGSVEPSSQRRASIADDYDPFTPTVEEPDFPGATARASKLAPGDVDEDGVIDSASIPAGASGAAAASAPSESVPQLVSFGAGARGAWSLDDVRRPAYLRRRVGLPREILAWRSAGEGGGEPGEVLSLEPALVVPRRLEEFYRKCERHHWRFTFEVGSPGYAESAATYDALSAEARESEEKTEVFEAFANHAFSGPAFSKPRQPKPLLAKATVSEVV
jgi:hypothetical protein